MPARLRSLLVVAPVVLALSSPALAAVGATLAAPGGPGQQALALRVEAQGVRVHACAAAPCAPDGGTVVAPDGGAKLRVDQAKITTVTLDGGRVVARVDIPGEAEGSTWVLLVAAPLAGEGGELEPVWQGFVGPTAGETGEEVSFVVRTDRAPHGGARLLVGQIHADVTVCGRPAVVAARAVDPATLKLVRGASVQSLGDEERAKAVKLHAERASDAAPARGAQVLRATVASSAVDREHGAGVVTDGDLATSWSENKAGDGRGELVSMSAPEEVGITALDLVIRPTTEVPEGAAPKRFYLATPASLFEVTMPEDAFQKPAGTRYTVKLPAELHTACLAVVLEEAYGHGDARVTLAEVSARTAFDGATPEALAGALAGGGKRAAAAAALLVRSGPRGIAAAVGAFDKLDQAGQRLVGEVVDAAPCRDQVPFFAARFAAATAAAPARAPASRAAPAVDEVDPDLAHARDRLRRCGRASAPALAELVAKGAPRTRALAADELAALAPAEAVPVLLDALAQVDDEARRDPRAALAQAADEARRDLRAALARAAKSPRAVEALREEMAKEKLAARSEAVAIDLLRAVGPSLGRIEGAAAAFADLGAQRKSFRARYLLQAPAAELALVGDAAAVEYLRHSLREDSDPHVRARAAEVAGVVPALAGRLTESLADADPRVREAAVNSIADAAARAAPEASAVAALRERLAKDDWTFVRAGAARSLGALPADAETDRVLAAALTDVSPDVRGRALDGLGAHHAAAHADAVRARQNDDAETLDVRAHAVLALGALCDARSLDDWTKLARAAKAPADDRDRRLGGAAIATLGQVHPPDLAARLAPLLDKDAPPGVREMAKAALAAPAGCRGGG